MGAPTLAGLAAAISIAMRRIEVRELSFRLFNREQRPQCINSMHLKHGFGQIQLNGCNLLHGWLPSLVLSTTQLWHTDAVRGPSTPSSPWAEDPRIGNRREPCPA
jgi:hypothetical protein